MRRGKDSDYAEGILWGLCSICFVLYCLSNLQVGRKEGRRDTPHSAVKRVVQPCLEPQEPTKATPGGGLDFKCRQIVALMDPIGRREVKGWILACRDRLTRFGFGWFEHDVRANGCDVPVLNQE